MRNLIFFIPLILIFSTQISASIHAPPLIRDKPDDLIYQVETTNNTLVWVFEADESNDAPSKYTATLDGVPIENHTLASWSDLVEVVINVDGLVLGSYVVTVEVNDTGTDALQAASAIDSVNVHVVEDTANPFPSTTSSTLTTTTTTSTVPSTTATTFDTVSDDISSSPTDTSSESESQITDTTTSASVPNLFLPEIISLLSVGILTWRKRL